MKQKNDAPKGIYEIFKTQGPPTFTYIRQHDGFFENKLHQSLESRGVVCILTGPSKTGKTTLYSKVLEKRGVEVLSVRCYDELSTTEFWRSCLEKVNFDRIEQRQREKTRSVKAGGKVSGTMGWKWLLGLQGEVSTEASGESSETEIRQKVLAEASPDHLIPILRDLPVQLVVEDFHYLQPAVQRSVFQQWKSFVDKEISVLIVSTTHHAGDLAHANRDLVGRIAQIDLPMWRPDDLVKIAVEGFKYMNVDVPPEFCAAIAKESVGLPIITQSVCGQLLLNYGIDRAQPRRTVYLVTTRELNRSLYEVATNRYQVFESTYERLTRGPRQRIRRFNTYELILSTFVLDPMTSVLRKEEITERLHRLKVKLSELPPETSITSTLEAIGPFQRRLGVELLEWSDRTQCLYILEPTFLYYLRWRRERHEAPSTADVLTDMLSDVPPEGK